VLFADDTSELIAARNLNNLRTKAVYTVTQINEWFEANGPIFNSDKRNVIHFKLNYLQDDTFHITCQVKKVKDAKRTTFLGIVTDNHMKWKTLVDLILPNFSGTCCIIKSVYFLSDISTLKTTRCAYFHSVINYDILSRYSSLWLENISCYKRKL
jgi:hypothetical protein